LRTIQKICKGYNDIVLGKGLNKSSNDGNMKRKMVNKSSN
jgi:hypothetical protein